uniref:Uncharacterized protein n=1 Tax=Arundo donax TaxID=35708 RepID=A0A0A9C686_ARUDO
MSIATEPKAESESYARLATPETDPPAAVLYRPGLGCVRRVCGST